MKVMDTVSGHKPCRLTAKGAAMRTRIIEAAADLIDEHGVNGTSLDDVMAKSGASKSQVYHYFRDKDDLVCEVISHHTHQVIDSFRPYMESLDSLDALIAWKNAVITGCQMKGGRGGCPIGSIANEMADQCEVARTVLAGCFETMIEQIESGLTSMKAKGVLRRDADPHRLSVAILGAIQGGMLLAKTERSTVPLELAMDMALDHIARHLA